MTMQNMLDLVLILHESILIVRNAEAISIYGWVGDLEYNIPIFTHLNQLLALTVCLKCDIYS